MPIIKPVYLVFAPGGVERTLPQNFSAGSTANVNDAVRPCCRVETFLKSLLEAYRRRTAVLDDLEQRPVQAYVNLGCPTQLIGIQTPDPVLSAVVVIHSPNLPDGDITTICCARWDLFQELERVLADEKWRTPLPAADQHSIYWHDEEHESTLRTILHQAFRIVHDQVRSRSMREPSAKTGDLLGQRMLLVGNSGLWIGATDALDADTCTIVDSIVKQRVERPSREAHAESSGNEASSVGTQETKYSGHGAFHTPGIRLGRVEDMSMAERELAKHAIPGRLVFRDTLGGHEFVATDSGFLGVLHADRTEVHRLLGFLGYAMLEAGIPTHSFREVRMGSFHPPPPDTDPFFWGGTWPLEDKPDDMYWPGRWIDDGRLRTCLRRADELRQAHFSHHIAFLLEARSYMLANQPREALVFAWSVVETEVNRRWGDLQKQREYSSKRRQRLNQNDQWNVSNRIEALEIAGLLASNLLEPVQQARRLRNETLHGNRAPAVADVDQVLMVATELVGAPEI